MTFVKMPSILGLDKCCLNLEFNFIYLLIPFLPIRPPLSSITPLSLSLSMPFLSFHFPLPSFPVSSQTLAPPCCSLRLLPTSSPAFLPQIKSMQYSGGLLDINNYDLEFNEMQIPLPCVGYKLLSDSPLQG